MGNYKQSVDSSLCENSRKCLSESELAWIRGHFPSLRRFIYLDAARKAPLSNAAADAMAAYIEEALCCRDTKLLHLQQVDRARDAISKLLNTDVDKFRFCSSTSEATMLALISMGDHLRDRIGVIEGLHPSVMAAVRFFAGKNKVTRLEIPRRVAESDRFEDHLADVSVLCASRISGGGRQYSLSRVSSILANRGIALVLDEAQSAGIYELEKFMCPTAHCFTLQKAFACPPGIGVVCFSDNWDMDKASNWDFGITNQHVLSAVPASTKIFESISRTQIRAHINWLSQRFKELMQPTNLLLQPEERAPHIQLLDLPGCIWQSYFRTHGIIVGESKGKLRVSFGFYTAEEDLMIFADRLAEGLRNGQPID